VTIAIIGGIPLTCIDLLYTLLFLMISDDPGRHSHSYFLAVVFYGSLAVAWLPLGVAYKLSFRGRTALAYVIASIPAVLTLATAPLLIRYWLRA
jgi:hypothetical protein